MSRSNGSILPARLPGHRRAWSAAYVPRPRRTGRPASMSGGYTATASLVAWPPSSPRPTACSTTWTRSSARPSSRRAGRSRSSPAPGPARPASSARRTAYAIATGRRRRRTRSWSSRSRTRPRARWSSGCAALGLPGVDGADVPRARAVASCATSGRAATTASRCPQLLDSKLPILGRLARGAARPLPVHAGQGPRRRDRMGEGAPDRAPDGYEAEAERAPARAADPGRPVRARLRRLRAGEGAGRAGSTSTTCSSRRSTCSRATPRRPRSSAPASAGSASTSTRTRTRSSSGCSSCGSAIARHRASSATRTRRSTRSPARRRRT